MKGNFVGVVAENEWAAIRAAQALKVTWTDAEPAFPRKRICTTHANRHTESQQGNSQKGRRCRRSGRRGEESEGNLRVAVSVARHHGPGLRRRGRPAGRCDHGLVRRTKAARLAKGFAELLRVPLDKVRVIWVEDAGSYGRPGFEDAAADAVLLSRAVGKPVRVQWTRADMTSWGTKGPQ